MNRPSQVQQPALDAGYATAFVVVIALALHSAEAGAPADRAAAVPAADSSSREVSPTFPDSAPATVADAGQSDAAGEREARSDAGPR